MNKALLKINRDTLLVSLEDACTIMQLLASAVPMEYSFTTRTWQPVDGGDLVVEVQLLSAVEVAKMALSQ